MNSAVARKAPAPKMAPRSENATFKGGGIVDQEDQIIGGGFASV